MKARVLKDPHGRHLSIRKQRCLEDKVWEVMGRGYVCSAWDCESHREEGIWWPSFQAFSHISELCPSHLPCAPGGNPALTTPDFVFEDSTPTLSPQASLELSCPYETGPCGNRQFPTLSRTGPDRLHPELSRPQPQLRTLPLSLHHGGLTPQNPLLAAFFPFSTVMCLCSGFL